MALTPAVDWNTAFTNTASDIATILPKIVVFLVILLVGWLIAALLARAVDAILERVGFDRAVERGGIGRMMSRSKYDASDLAARIVFWGIMLFALQAAFGVFGPNPVSDMLANVVAWLPKLFVALVIIVVAAAIANGVRDIVGGALSGTSYGRVMANVVYAFILGLGIIAALDQIGVATTVTMPVLIAVLATIAGILIVGVGGGLIMPMRSRWDRWLGQAEQETIDLRTRSTERQRQYAGGGSTSQPYPPAPGYPSDAGQGYATPSNPAQTYPGQAPPPPPAADPYRPSRP